MTEDERLCGGNFRLLFEDDDPFRRLLDGFYVWPQSHGSCYGDSGKFVRRDVYDTMGGIRPNIDGGLRFRPPSRSAWQHVFYLRAASSDIFTPL